MLRPEDYNQINARGSSLNTVKQQIANFKTGFPPLKLIEPAGIYHGLIVLSESEVNKYASIFDDKIANGLNVLKFVPASGAATRMFKSLFSALESLQKGTSTLEILKDPEVLLFYNQIECFAFYDQLIELASADKQQKTNDLSLNQLLENLLSENGLNYGNLPKGLLTFHKYPDGNRTAVEEHFVE
jgi:hypothetical protein